MIELKVKRLTGFAKVKGLLNAKKAQPILFKTRFGIHTFGMKFPIDVIILDNQNRVVSMSQALNPNRVLFWNPICTSCIELPMGKVKELKIKKGDTIKVITN